MKRILVIWTLLLSLAAFAMTPANAADLKDDFLDCLKTERIPVSVYLVNGIKLQGQIIDWTDDVIFLKNSVNQLVFVNAISTVIPARDVTGEKCLFLFAQTQ